MLAYCGAAALREPQIACAHRTTTSCTTCSDTQTKGRGDSQFHAVVALAARCRATTRYVPQARPRLALPVKGMSFVSASSSDYGRHYINSRGGVSSRSPPPGRCGGGPGGAPGRKAAPLVAPGLAGPADGMDLWLISREMRN